MHTMHEVREDMGSLVVTVMCNVPSQYPFTLIVRTSDGTAVGEQIEMLLYVNPGSCMIFMYFKKSAKSKKGH